MTFRYIQNIRFSFFNSEIELKKIINSWILENSARSIFACDIRSLLLSRTDDDLFNAYERADMVISDGKPLFWIGRDRENIHITGPTFFRLLIDSNDFKNFKHYFIGGPQDTLDKIKNYCVNNDLNFVGSYCPPFGSIESFDLDEMLIEIKTFTPDIIWIGLGAPKQEIIADIFKANTEKGLFVGVGLAFDYLAGNVKIPPKVFSKFGLEWLWRYFQQPKKIHRFVKPFFFGLYLLFKNLSKIYRF